MAQETGKQRVSRIEPDYFHRPNRLERGKRLVAWAGALAAVAWWSSGFLLGDRGRIRYSHGPLAAVHATWDSQCAACHEDFKPVRDDALGQSLDCCKGAGDQKCQACHAGPLHNQKQIDDQIATCAACHQDHRGRDANLARMDDRMCTTCHQDLTQHLKEGKATTFKDVARFDLHPKFRSIDHDDPGKLKFSHRTHLNAGLRPDADSKTEWTLEQIPLSQRKRYDRFLTDGVLQLDCSACHQLDSGEAGTSQIAGMPSGLLPPRAAGAYMLPITYENQCRACHELPYSPGQPSTLEPGSPELVLHRQSHERLRDFLVDRFANQYLHDNPSLMEKTIAPRRQSPNKPDEETVKAREHVEGQVHDAQQHLHTVCAKCHSPDPQEPQKLLAVEPVNVPQVWLQHARFDHAAHRAVDCLQCHAGAAASSKNTDVLIPDVEKCVECHRSSTADSGGARFDCVECHRYHGGGDAFQGLGAGARGVTVKLPIDDFLSGVTNATNEKQPAENSPSKQRQDSP